MRVGLRILSSLDSAAGARISFPVRPAAGARWTCGRSPCEIENGLARPAEITVAVMGCMVNGPGEAKEADVGVACGRGAGVLFKGGKLLRRVPEKRIVPSC